MESDSSDSDSSDSDAEDAKLFADTISSVKKSFKTLLKNRREERQELNKRIEDLEEGNGKLEDEISELETRAEHNEIELEQEKKIKRIDARPQERERATRRGLHGLRQRPQNAS